MSACTYVVLVMHSSTTTATNSHSKLAIVLSNWPAGTPSSVLFQAQKVNQTHPLLNWQSKVR